MPEVKPSELAELQLRLEEAEETIRAIRSGSVDAFLVEVPTGAKVYTLDSADRPYRLLVEEMQQGAITLSSDGTIAYCNRRFADLVGKPLERLLGIAFHEFIPFTARPFYEGLLHEGRSGCSQGETHVQKFDGTLVPVFLTINALPADSGVAIGLLVTDLTSQRHQEKLNALLAELKESDRRKNEFLAMLAHELRNPLAPIRNAVSLLRLAQQADVETIQSVAGMMERQLGQMARLIDDLLDISRISRGTIDLRCARIELASAIHHAIDAARTLVDDKVHTLTLSLPPQPVYLNADPTRFAQVVGNLLSNACKFTDKGGQIWLTVAVEEAHGMRSSIDPSSEPTLIPAMATIGVKDSGMGLAADQLARIFEMFVQVDTSIGRPVSGLGIGLALVKRLVEMHGGSVEVTSAGIGQGSEFVVRMPVLVEAPAPPRPPIAEPKSITARRILVVDDNRDSATSLAMLLKFTGNKTQMAFDGLEAVEVAAVFLPDIVLLDIGMPKLNGYDACRQMRAQPWGKSMVLVALTGWGEDEARQKSKEAGFDGHIVKPVDHDVLSKLLAELLPIPA